jgi:subtilisin-like proprotein convertase family protein
MEARRLLSASLQTEVAAYVLADQPVWEIAAALGGEESVSTRVAGAWSRATDLTQYTARELQAPEWAVAMPAGLDVDGLAKRLPGASVGESGLIDRVAVVMFDPRARQDPLTSLRLAGVGAGSAYPLVVQERTTRFTPDDAYFDQQWHLQNTGQGGGTAGADANVPAAWAQLAGSSRVDGTNITIGIVDDGVWGSHPDLAANFDAASSWDFLGGDPNPSGGGHGTQVAGVAAATGDNGIGVTGVAFDANVAGLRLLGANSDSNESAALSWAPETIDVYSNSWGPFDDGRRFEGPGPLTEAAIEQSATLGRGGLGAVLTWAGGNGGSSDNVNRDGYANSRHTIAIGAVNNFGNQSGYSEDGAPLLVVAPSNGGSRSITTTSGSSSYTSSFGGTSSANPLVSGVVALMLEANPLLTQRDIQHILVETSVKGTPGTGDWVLNGAGLAVSHGLGFGRVDAGAAVQAAFDWQPVAAEATVAAPPQAPGLVIPDGDLTGITRTFDLPAGLDLEYVELTLDIDHTYRGDLSVNLTSPSGTVSRLLERNFDSFNNIDQWTLTTARHWGEDSGGTWTLQIVDEINQDQGTLNSVVLEAFGTIADVTAPSLVETAFAFESSQSFRFVFDEPVVDSLAAMNLDVVNTTLDTSIPASAFAFTPSPDGTGGVWTHVGDSPLPDGNYVATLPAGLVTDAAGNPVLSDTTLEFFVLAGDANRDRTVNLGDFLALRRGFGESGVFSEGDFNYDGTVDLSDFLVLRRNFGVSLPDDGPEPGSLFD